jgi:hypothetical protein
LSIPRPLRLRHSGMFLAGIQAGHYMIEQSFGMDAGCRGMGPLVTKLMDLGKSDTKLPG